MKRKKLVLTTFLFVSLLIGGSSLVGCDLLVTNINNSTSKDDPLDFDDSLEEGSFDTITSTDHVDDPIEENPTTSTDTSNQEPDLEPTTYKVTYTSSSDYTVSGLEDSYEEGDTVSFRINITNDTKEISSVAWNNNVIEDNDGIYSFLMPEEDVDISITTTNKSYAVTYETSDDYSINIISGTEYEYESMVEFVVTPSIGKKITKVTISEGTLNSNGSNGYCFVMPSKAVVIAVTTTDETYIVSYDSTNLDYTISGLNSSYTYQETVSFTVTPSTGKKISEVTISSGGVVQDNGDNMYSFIMPAEAVIILVETENESYTVSYETSSNYTISGLNSSYTYESIVSFTVTPSTGKKISNVSISASKDVEENSNNTYSFIMPAEDVTIYVTTADEIYTVSYEESSNYTISGLNSSYTYGSTVSFTVTPADGMRVSSVTISSGGTVNDNGNNSYSFSMPASDVTINIEVIDEFMEQYGYGNAFNTTGSAYLYATSYIEYYIDSSITGSYLTAVKYAIEKANELTDAVTITTTTDSNSSFVIKKESAGLFAGYSGKNTFSYYVNNGKIIASTIVLNSSILFWYTTNGIKHVALHEIGHTFGLTDLYDSTLKNYSIMYYTDSKTYTEYQDFDKANIAWRYDS